MGKFKVPKEITKEETLRVKEELKSGKFLKTIADTKLYKDIIKRNNEAIK